MRRIRHAAVLGAGTMGAQIAAHLANAGVPTLLLDVSAEAAHQGLERARSIKPDPFFTPETHRLIRTGSVDDLSGLSGCDWIIEAVVERLDVKQALLERVEQHVNPDAIVSSNTSAIPLSAIAAGRGEGLRRRWLGTHFFNPPRYLRLLEVIPTADTSPDVIDTIARFADWRLGKGVVVAKDTPGFIANRIGIFGLLQLLQVMTARGYTVEEVDAITGPAIGRPKSATFRTLDVAGLDVLASVVKDLSQRLPDGEGSAFELPRVVSELVSRGWIGAKVNRGFYFKTESGEIHALDPETLEYKPGSRPRFPSIDAARDIDDTGKRIAQLFRGKDRVGELLRAALAPTILYAARVAPKVAYSFDDVDRALRWGFGWDLGPFETLRAIGVDDVLEALEPDQRQDALPILTRAFEGRDFGPGGAADTAGRPSPAPAIQRPAQLIARAKSRNAVVRRNPGASLLDIGDGVLCLEFHSKMNAIGGDTIQMLLAGVREAETDFAALVVANDALHFSAGANLMLLLLEAQEGNWDEVDLMVRSFQQATMAIKHAQVPVVVCPAGLTLGGACELALHADRVQAAAESYIGLVEVGVGLIPAGGGTKELLARAMDDLAPGSDALPAVRRVFETIAFAKTSSSGVDARRLGYLRHGDGITMNRERLVEDAKAVALLRARTFVPAMPRTAIPVGGPTVQAALKLGVHLALRAGRISEHDALIGRKLAWILSGGNAPAGAAMTEQQLLDLEREAFLSLCGEPKTQERIAYTLKTGKTLRN